MRRSGKDHPVVKEEDCIKGEVLLPAQPLTSCQTLTLNSFQLCLLTCLMEITLTTLKTSCATLSVDAYGVSYEHWNGLRSMDILKKKKKEKKRHYRWPQLLFEISFPDTITNQTISFHFSSWRVIRHPVDVKQGCPRKTKCKFWTAQLK